MKAVVEKCAEGVILQTQPKQNFRELCLAGRRGWSCFLRADTYTQPLLEAFCSPVHHYVVIPFK